MGREIYKDIPGYEGLYKISNYGTVKRTLYKNQYKSFKKSRILKKRYNKKGYITVILYKNNVSKSFAVHRLVATVFLGDNKTLQVNHIDGNKQNNKVENLEWCTNKENQNHAWKLGLQKPKRYGRNGMAKRVYQLDLNGNIINEFDSISRANEYFGKKMSHVCSCCKKKRNMALGYKWKYVDDND